MSTWPITKSAACPLVKESAFSHPKTRLFKVSATYRCLGVEFVSTATPLAGVRSPILPRLKFSPAPSTKFWAFRLKTICPNTRSAVVSPVAAGRVVTTRKQIKTTFSKNKKGRRDSCAEEAVPRRIRRHPPDRTVFTRFRPLRLARAGTILKGGEGHKFRQCLHAAAWSRPSLQSPVNSAWNPKRALRPKADRTKSLEDLVLRYLS
jgi:hypothetical protein